MSTKKRAGVAGGVPVLVALCAALAWSGCKGADDERPPAPAVTAPAAPVPTSAPARDTETATRKFELSSSALALQAKASKDGEDALAAACTALDEASRKDCDAVKRAATRFKEAKDGLRGDTPKMLGDSISRIERAIEALCP